MANFEKSDDISSCYSLSKKISTLLNSGLNGNPRQFKRFLNEFEMRKNVAKLKNIDINEKVLVKMMILQYVKPNIFTDFIDLYGKGTLDIYLQAYLGDDDNKENLNDKTKRQKNISDNVKEKKWQNEWFEKWMKDEPNISEENLEPYFYLSRNNNTLFDYTPNISYLNQQGKYWMLTWAKTIF